MTMVMDPLAPWFRDLNRYFATGTGGAASFVPAVDVFVTDEDVTVDMDVPGVTRDNLAIELPAARPFAWHVAPVLLPGALRTARPRAGPEGSMETILIVVACVLLLLVGFLISVAIVASRVLGPGKER